MNLNERSLNGEKTNSSYSSIIYNYSTSTTINNVTVVKSERKNLINPIETWVYEDFHQDNKLVNTDTIPTFLNQCDTISLPKGVKRAIERLPKKLLKPIDEDLKIAVEKCLIIASNCTSTLFKDNEIWTNLSSTILNEQVKKGKDNTFIYKSVIKVLQYSTDKTHPIIEIKKNSYGNSTYVVGERSMQYKFHDSYKNLNIVNYELKNQDSIQKRRKYFLEKLNKAYKEIIPNNLINLYTYIELPSEDEIEQRGKELIMGNYITNKGKKLASLNNKKRENIKDFQDKSFVEDAIKRFRYLTSKGYIIPAVGSYKSGGRVADTFNLMNSWIRKMVKINGENISVIDFKALHPNLAIKIYEGFRRFITHQQIADFLNKDVKEVKIEHLSFFNKHPNQMKKSILFKYYSEREPKMLEKILDDKKMNGYKITSIRMFALEVAIMKSCIIRLNADNEYVGYVYDALFCKESVADKVLKIMNEEILKHGVYTTACKE
jgi:hypothetical protein